MTQCLLNNNANSQLASPISSGATSVTLLTGTGALYPNPGAGQFFPLTFNDALTGLVYEIVYCTARSGDVLTISRHEEGTSAVSWLAGDFANHQMTAGTQQLFPQLGAIYEDDSGAANAYVVTLFPALASYTQSFPFWVNIANANTGASTINFGPGNVPLMNNAGGALVSGDLLAGGFISGVYDYGQNLALISGILPSQIATAGFSKITSIVADAPLNGGGSTPTVHVGLANSGVTAASYILMNATVDAKGRITAASNGTNWPAGTGTGNFIGVQDGSVTPYTLSHTAVANEKLSVEWWSEEGNGADITINGAQVASSIPSTYALHDKMEIYLGSGDTVTLNNPAAAGACSFMMSAVQLAATGKLVATLTGTASTTITATGNIKILVNYNFWATGSAPGLSIDGLLFVDDGSLPNSGSIPIYLQNTQSVTIATSGNMTAVVSYEATPNSDN